MASGASGNDMTFFSKFCALTKLVEKQTANTTAPIVVRMSRWNRSMLISIRNSCPLVAKYARAHDAGRLHELGWSTGAAQHPTAEYLRVLSAPSASVGGIILRFFCAPPFWGRLCTASLCPRQVGVPGRGVAGEGGASRGGSVGQPCLYRNLRLRTVSILQAHLSDRRDPLAIASHASGRVPC